MNNIQKLALTSIIFTGLIMGVPFASAEEVDPETISVDEQIETTMGAIIIEGKSETETTVHGLSEDGKVRVEIVASNPIADEAMSLDLKFRDSSGGGLKKHANYDIVVTQNGKEIFSESDGHNHEGNAMYTTIPLESEDPVDIQLTLLGFGLPDEKANWTGPKGEVLMFNVVPEFGAITMMILAVGIISIIAVIAKSRIIPRL